MPAHLNSLRLSLRFFSNKGAVAGVFTVVGLVVLALVIALIVNAIRRRRAEKFDRDVAEAAAEAAASSRSPFDEYSYGNSGGNGGGGGGGYGYSDNSHGTYQLPPMSPQNVPYGMSEMSQYDPYTAGAASLAAAAVGRSRSRKESEPGAPGIAGVGAGTLGREPSKRAPYHAFAGPVPQPPELPGQNDAFGSRRSHQDVLEAAGLAGAGAAAFSNNTNNAGGAYVTRKPSDTTQNTQFSGGRSKFGSMSSGGHHPTTLQPGYPVDSYYPQRNDSISPDPFAGYPVTTVPPSQPLSNPHGAAPLPSIAGHPSEHHEDYDDSGSPTALRSDEPRMSYQDNTDYSQGHRVLRVRSGLFYLLFADRAVCRWPTNENKLSKRHEQWT